MTLTFLRLKVRLLRNTLRGSGGFGLVIFTFVAFVAGITAAIWVGRVPPDDRLIVGPLLGTALIMSWTLAPLLFGASDETIDTTRLAMFPLDSGPLAAGLAAAGLIGPGPMAASLPLVAVALQAPNPLSVAIAVMAAVLTLLMATAASRWLLTELGSRLRRRRSRDLATLLAGLGAGLFGLGLQAFSRLGPDVTGSDLSRAADIVRYTPLGWSGDALGRASTGQVGMAAVELLAVGALLVLVLRRWINTLEHALTEVDDGAVTEQLHGHLVGPDRLLGRFDPQLSAVFAKERRYLFRHPRYRVQVVSQGTVLLVGGAPFLSAIIARNPAAVLLGCIPGLTAGVTGSNLLGSDGRALWGEVVAMSSLRPVLRGRSLAFVGIGCGAATVITLGVAGWTGGWPFAPVALTAAVGMAFAGAGIGAYTSTIAPTPLPDDDSPNPFATSSPGSGCLNGIATVIGVLAGLATAAPILLGLALTQRGWSAGLLTSLLAPPYGFALWLFATDRAARRADRRTPELLLTLTSG